jgi:polyphosphate kinase 2
MPKTKQNSNQLMAKIMTASTNGFNPLANGHFDAELRSLQAELVKLQRWVSAQGLRICVLFEGRDAAGKGGVIKAITDRVSHRVFRVYALPIPNDREKGQIYMQRYISLMPTQGEVAIFDRSWYNRAGVEKVLGFCSKQESEEFLSQTPNIEKYLVESGILLIKYYLEVGQEQQKKRLEDRYLDASKNWKLSAIDGKSISRWYDYSRARDEMLKRTHTPWAPWYVVDFNDKKRGQLNLITHLLSLIPYRELPFEHTKLPKRQSSGSYVEMDLTPYKIPEVY